MAERRVAVTALSAAGPADECAHRSLRRASDLSRMAVVAADRCLAVARLDADPAVRERTGVTFGTCFGSCRYHLEYHEALEREGVKGASPLLFSESVFNAPPGHVSQTFGLGAPSVALVGGEEVILSAIADAADRILLDEADAMLAGGGEERYELVERCLQAQALLAGDASMPQGVCLLLLEDLVAVRRAGRRVLCELLGWARRRGHDAALEAARLATGRLGIDPGAAVQVGPGFDSGLVDFVSSVLGGRDDGSTHLLVAASASGAAVALLFGPAIA